MKRTVKCVAIYLAWMLATMPVFPQQIIAPIFQSAPVTVCTAPTVTNRYMSDNPANVCTGGCTNGNTLTQLTDMVGTYNLGPNTGTTTYFANALGSHPAINFSTSALANGLIRSSTTQMSMYAIINLMSAGGDIVGGIPNFNNSYQWNASNVGHLCINSNFVAGIGCSSSNVSPSTYVTIASDYNTSTGAFHYYSCSGGTCTGIGSGTNLQSMTREWSSMGISTGNPGSTFRLLEYGSYDAGLINTTTLGTYSQCQYGI